MRFLKESQQYVFLFRYRLFISLQISLTLIHLTLTLCNTATLPELQLKINHWKLSTKQQNNCIRLYSNKIIFQLRSSFFLTKICKNLVLFTLLYCYFLRFFFGQLLPKFGHSKLVKSGILIGLIQQTACYLFNWFTTSLSEISSQLIIDENKQILIE